jgi:hypothetical protein
MTPGSAARLGLGVTATLVVWIAVLLQLVFLQPLKDRGMELCGTGAAIFTVWLAACWGLTLLVLLYDSIQMYRGRLARPFRWLRTLPAAVAVMLTPAVFSLT